jgi:hypothetical protein
LLAKLTTAAAAVKAATKTASVSVTAAATK